MATDSANVPGAGQRLFADPVPPPPETSFQVDNTSEQYYQSPYYLLHKAEIQPVPPPRSSPPRIDLSDVLAAAVLDPITQANRIAFHAVGDTGAAKVNHFQTAAMAIANEASVADAMTADLEHPTDTPTPAFFFHLGDVIYYFGEAQYYYDQFYDPFRSYDRPIFAIPGNHDGAVFGQDSSAPQTPTLAAFLGNFCTTSPGPSPDAGGLVRSTMTQPGVYFTLDAPCVSVIGLYTNVLEGPGVISSQGGKYPLSDDQLQFLTTELARLKPARQALERAVIIACHHPPVSVDPIHGGSTGLATDIDTACKNAGLWPDAVLSGHAHLYQRFTRQTANRQIPYIVSGSGGFAATKPTTPVKAPHTIGEYTLVAPPLVEFGFLTLTIDLAAQPATLTISFDSRGLENQDTVTINLTTNQLTPTSKQSTARRPRNKNPRKRPLR